MGTEPIASERENNQEVDYKKPANGAREFWATATRAENIALLSRIAKLKSKGIDVEGLFALIEEQFDAGTRAFSG